MTKLVIYNRDIQMTKLRAIQNPDFDSIFGLRNSQRSVFKYGLNRIKAEKEEAEKEGEGEEDRAEGGVEKGGRKGKRRERERNIFGYLDTIFVILEIVLNLPLLPHIRSPLY